MLYDPTWSNTFFSLVNHGKPMVLGSPKLEKHQVCYAKTCKELLSVPPCYPVTAQPYWGLVDVWSSHYLAVVPSPLMFRLGKIIPLLRDFVALSSSVRNGCGQPLAVLSFKVGCLGMRANRKVLPSRCRWIWAPNLSSPISGFLSDLYVCCSMFELSFMWEEARQILPAPHLQPSGLTETCGGAVSAPPCFAVNISWFSNSNGWLTAGEPPEKRLTARLQKPLADPSVGFVGSVLSSVELTLHSEYGHLRSIRSQARLNFRQFQNVSDAWPSISLINMLYHFDPFCQYFAYVFS